MRVTLVHYKTFNVSYYNPEKELISEKFEECLVFYYSLEIADTRNTIDELINLVMTFEGPVNNKIFFPYAHLTTRQLNIHEAKDLNKYLTSQTTLPVMPFGISKGIESIQEIESVYQHCWVLRGFPVDPQQGRSTMSVVSSNINGPSSLLTRLYLQESRDESLLSKAHKDELEFPEVWSEKISERGQYTLGPRATTFLEVLNNYFINSALTLPFRVEHISGAEWFDITNSAVAQHLRDFGGLDHSYLIETSERVSVLRHAACYQAFNYLSRKKVLGTSLPRGVMELATCYRNEKKGELSPLYRTSRFSMVDIHVLIDLSSYQSVFNMLYSLVERVRQEVSLEEYIPMICYRSSKAKATYSSFLTTIFPEHIESIKESEHVYWAFNIEFHLPGRGEDSKLIELATIQLDELNPSRFGIKTLGDTTLGAFHLAILGSTERAAYILTQHGIPFFLAPEQIRVILSKGNPHEAHLHTLFREFRYAIDNRNKSTSRRVKQAILEEPPVIVIINEDLSVRVARGLSHDIISLEELILSLRQLNKGFTFGRRLYLIE